MFNLRLDNPTSEDMRTPPRWEPHFVPSQEKSQVRRRRMRAVCVRTGIGRPSITEGRLGRWVSDERGSQTGVTLHKVLKPKRNGIVFINGT